MTKVEIIHNMLDEKKHDKDKFKIVFELLSNMYHNDSPSPFNYTGSKRQMSDLLNKVFDKLYAKKVDKTGKGYTKFIDIFGGAVNSTLVLMDSLLITGCKDFIINDNNKCLIQVHKDIKDNSEEIIIEFCEIIRTKFIQKYGSIFLNKSQYNSIKEELVLEFEELQSEQEFGVATSTIFLLLRSLEFSGVVQYNKDGGYAFDKKIYTNSIMFHIIIKYISKVKKFKNIYNKLNIEFRNEDCFTLLEEDGIKNNPNCLINLDPPYLAQNDEKIDEKVLEQLTSNEIQDCTINYNEEFSHIDLLKKLSSMNFIYNNNQHPIIKYYAKKIDANILDYARPNTIGVKKGVVGKIAKEYILYKNSII